MNADLKFRLTPFEKLSGKEKLWLGRITAKLCKSIRSWYPINIHMVVMDPPEYPDDDTGYVEFDDSLPHDEKSFEIYLDNRMPAGMVIDYLIHELAHVGTWFVNEPEDHGPHFGVEWAKLYRVYLKNYLEFWDAYE